MIMKPINEKQTVIVCQIQLVIFVSNLFTSMVCGDLTEPEHRKVKEKVIICKGEVVLIRF